MEINGFDTLGELQKQFPIGAAVEWQEPHSYTAFFYNEKDLQLWRKLEGITSVEIIGENMVKITTKRQPITIITGYIFDGEKWWPAYETWDGWVKWGEED